MKALHSAVNFNNLVCIYPQAGLYASSIHKRSTIEWNSEFSFSKTCCLTKTKEPSLANNLPIIGRRTDGFIAFPVTSAKGET